MTAYVPGEAWAIMREHACIVLDRGVDAAAAAWLHAKLLDVRTLDELLALAQTQSLALAVAVAEGARWRVARRRGVPGAGDGGHLPLAVGEAWTEDSGLGAVRLGELSAPDPLPIVDGVVRVRLVVWGTAADAEARDEIVHAELPVVEPAAAVSGENGVDDIDGDTIVSPPTVADPPEQGAGAPTFIEDTIVSAPAPARAPSPSIGAWAPPAAPPETRIVPLPVPAPQDRAPSVASAPDVAPPPLLVDSVPGYLRAPAPASKPTADVPSMVLPAVPESARQHLVDDGDHDGLTLTAEQARALAQQAAEHAAAPVAGQPAAVPVPPSEPATGPYVLSTLCPNGHVNPSGVERCGRCDTPLDPASADRRPRPEVAVLVMPGGERIPLGRGVVLGRRPRSGRIEHGRVPRLVAVESPNEDISRTHLEVRFDDWTLVATDLESTNGTVLYREGTPPERLRAGVATLVQVGDRLDLGDGIVVTVEAAP